jgi:transcriptional regulator with XRE-family HTH domain
MRAMEGQRKLRAYLKANKLTQEDFARQAGLDGPQISQWVAGPRRPSLASAIKLQNATAGFISVHDWIPPKVKKPNRAA